MSIEIFTKDEFETQALPVNKVTGDRMWKHLGIIGGEHTYSIKIDNHTAIEVRSSIDKSGYSAEVGEDSIRAWLTDSNGLPLGSKVSKWTTRRAGWDERTKGVLRTLWGWRKKAGNCAECGEPKKIFKVKKEGQNKGRIFCDCKSGNCKNQFKWIESK
jgi:hypothetical protein